MAAAGAVPLAAGAVLPVGAVMDGAPLCPFRLATGLPCPLCGATRAIVLAAHGDPRWIDYGAVWVVVAVAAVLAGALVTLRGRPRLAVPPAAGAVGIGAVAWAWALAHADTIAP